ncbi:MAG: hypothetical protein KF893_11420 [Caldilineaceae bacterium]|nr:hypothetical protein [Caldilineaceae bacterium]
MSYQLQEERKTAPPRFRWLQLLLLFGFLFSLLIGLIALAGLYLLDSIEPQQSSVNTPPALIQPAQIPPHLALLQLAGADAEALGRQATSARERALAYAIIQYDNQIAAPRRAAEMLRLGGQFLEAGEMTQAMAAYRVVRTVGILSPEIPALERGQILMRAAVGLLESGATQEAVETAQQAQYVAIQLPGLLPAQRAEILSSVAPILRGHGSPEMIRQIDELLRNPNLRLNRVMLISQWSQLQEAAPVDPALEEVAARRQAAAQALIDRLVATRGQDYEMEREALRQILLEEDQLHSVRYERMNEVETLGQQHTLIEEQRAWLLLKLRIALGGFGVDLVPEWSGQPDALRLSLNQVTANLMIILQAQIAAKSDEAEAAMLRAEVYRWLAYQSELGFYPNPPMGELATQIDAAEAELERLNLPPALPAFYDVNATPPGFRIARRY